jgi:hypothetical protein
MILYQLTQWMEERSALHKALQLGAEDSSVLQGRMEQVEQQLHQRANQWRESIQEPSYLQIPYQTPQIDEEVFI